MSVTAPGPLHDLELLVRSRYGLVFLRTPEEDRAASLLRHLADSLNVPSLMGMMGGSSLMPNNGATGDATLRSSGDDAAGAGSASAAKPRIS